MSGFIEGDNRHQATLFPERLDDYISEGNSVRVIDVFIDSLNLSGLGFETIPNQTGRPGHHPSTMLKLYVYGYLKRVQSTRRLEREAQRNVELMWLLGRLVPDFKTIADFRKDNGEAIISVCREFVLLCKKLDLFSSAIVTADGSKFKAVNNSDRAFSNGKMKRRREKIDESIEKYLAEIKRADRQDTKESKNTKIRLKERLAKVKEEANRLKKIDAEMLKSPDEQIALTDPDARIMANGGRSSVMVGYNVQTIVDTENHLIITDEVTNVGNDRSQLTNMSKQAKSIIDCDHLEVVADRGYYKSEEILACAEANITTYLPKSQTSGNRKAGLYDRSDFIYEPENDQYRCPAGEVLSRRHRSVERGMTLDTYYASIPVCRACPSKSKCTVGESRRVRRWEHERVLDDLERRMANEPEKMQTRRSTVEHPFGSIKSWMGNTHFQIKTLPRVSIERRLHVLSYNIKRVIAILGAESLMAAIKA